MARKAPRLTLTITPAAQRDLGAIWDYNAYVHGTDHADNYLAFLDRETTKLEIEYSRGKSVPSREGILRITIRKGRVVVYQVMGQTVEVLRYFHTAQDWQSRAVQGKL